jgi:subtilisin family serine protease
MKFSKRLLSFALTLLLLFGAALPVAFASTGGDAVFLPDYAPKGYVLALSELVEQNWSNHFFSSITVQTVVAPDDDEILIPLQDIAQVSVLPMRFMANIEPYMTLQEVQAMGFEVQFCLHDETTATITAPYQTRRLLVGTETGVLGNTYGAVTALPLSGNRFALQYATEAQARNARAQLEIAPGVLYAEPDGILSANNFEIEPLAFVECWGVTRIGAQEFRALAPTNAPIVTVAVLDTGLDVTHPFFINRLSSVRWNFFTNNNNVRDGHGHGTMVASIVANASSRINNIKIMPLRVLDDRGYGSDSVVSEAVRFAADNGAHIANMSLGSTAIATNTWAATMAYAEMLGMITIAAAGNDGRNQLNYPAAIPGVIAVAATRQDNQLAWFSNWGSWVDIAAPGDNVVCIVPGDHIHGVFASGTSMAAPFVAAAAALVLTYQTDFPRDEMLSYLLSLADPRTQSGRPDFSILNINPRGQTGFLPSDVTVNAGNTVALVVAQSPPVPGQSYAFVSSNPDVVAVSPAGAAVALQPGTATVKAYGIHGLHATANITVRGIVRIDLGNNPPIGIRNANPTLRIRAVYNDGTTRFVDVNQSHFTGFVPGLRGWQTFTVSYGGQSMQVRLWADTRAYTSISVWSLPRLSYNRGEAFDPSNGWLALNWSGGGSDLVPMTLDMIEGYDPDARNRHTIDIVWNGIFVRSYVVNIGHRNFFSAEVVTPPTQTAFPPFRPIDPAGGVVRISYVANEIPLELTHEYIDMQQAMLEPASWNNGHINDNGVVTLSVNCYGTTVGNFDIQTPNPNVDLILVAMPDKLNYVEGEELDPTDGMVRFTLRDGTTFDYPLQPEWLSWGEYDAGMRRVNINVRNYNSGTNTARRWNMPGYFYVHYMHAAVAPLAHLESIALLNQPTQRQYAIGSRLNTAGGRLRLTMSDGSTLDVNLLAQHTTGFNPNQVGTQTILVNLSGLTTSFDVTVTGRAAHMEIATWPSQLVYGVWNSISLAGGTVRVTYDDDSTEIIPMTSARVQFAQASGGAPGSTGFDLVRVIVDGVTYADFWIVYVNASGFLSDMSGNSFTLRYNERLDLPVPDVYMRWTSSNERVLTVNTDGTVNHVGRGTTTLDLTFHPPGRAPVVVGRLVVTVNYTFWQWIMFIFFFGWIWM